MARTCSMCEVKKVEMARTCYMCEVKEVREGGDG